MSRHRNTGVGTLALPVTKKDIFMHLLGISGMVHREENVFAFKKYFSVKNDSSGLSWVISRAQSWSKTGVSERHKKCSLFFSCVAFFGKNHFTYYFSHMYSISVIVTIIEEIPAVEVWYVLTFYNFKNSQHYSWQTEIKVTVSTKVR